MNANIMILKKLLSLSLSIFVLFAYVNIVDGKEKDDYYISVRPGESKTIIIPIKSNSVDRFRASYIIMTGSNLVSKTGDVTAFGSSYCTGIQKAVNSLGNTLYQWNASAQYDFTGAVVDVWGHGGIPGSWWGWSFDHESWAVTGNGTATASAASTGYFTHPTVGREYARIKFVIQKNGSCSLSGSTGTW